MRRDRVAAPLLALLMLAVSVGTLSAGSPPLGDGVRPVGALPLDGESTRKVDGQASTSAVPGENGWLAFAVSPYLGYPNTVWLMADDGGGKHQLTTGALGVGQVWPEVSPGGRYVAYTNDQLTGEDQIEGDIYVVPFDGSTASRRLTTAAANDAIPSWTPDGARIVFGSDRNDNIDIYSVAVDGTGLKRLTSNAAIDHYPVVSPDGTKIAFASDRSVGNMDVYVMDIDGTDVTRLTTSTAADYQPEWSPDGTKIAFTSTRTGDYEIFSMSATGSGQVNLTQDPSYHDLDASWSPDGTKIVFWGVADADTDIFMMDSNGGLQTAVGSTGDDEWGPAWQPLPDFPLVDAKFSPFNAAIVWVYEQGITTGCSLERYCATANVTRGEMATFLVRALDLPATVNDYFNDDETSTHENSINRIRAAGITTGCAPNKYCPTANVTRGEMATFLVRALELPPTLVDAFTDDETSTHEDSINRVKAAGITSGCSPTTFCPTAPVTRGQMAAFLQRALD